MLSFGDCTKVHVVCYLSQRVDGYKCIKAVSLMSKFRNTLEPAVVHSGPKGTVLGPRPGTWTLAQQYTFVTRRQHTKCYLNK